MGILAHALTALICMQFASFSHEFHDEARRFLEVRGEILTNPHLAVDAFCARAETLVSATQKVTVTLEWRQGNVFVSPCKTPPTSRRWPPRYYRIRLDYQFSIGQNLLGPLTLETIYFR
jgi:hypothetical protein